MDARDDDSAEDEHLVPIHIHYDAGYYPEFEQWNVFFNGERIYRLERWLEMA